MAKSRLVSSDLSKDESLNTAIEEGGYLAGIIYTLGIVHADAQGRLPGDSTELILKVFPVAYSAVWDYEKAIRALVKHGLLWSVERGSFFVLDLDRYEPRRRTDSHRARKWRESVVCRDNHTCRHCGAKPKRVFAHHIQHWAAYPELRFDIDNGLTLCEDCHNEEHYG